MAKKISRMQQLGGAKDTMPNLLPREFGLANTDELFIGNTAGNANLKIPTMSEVERVSIYSGTSAPPYGSKYAFWAVPESSRLPIKNPLIHYDVNALSLENATPVNYLPDISSNGYDIGQPDETLRPIYYIDELGRGYILFDTIIHERCCLEGEFAAWEGKQKEKFTMFIALDTRNVYTRQSYVFIGESGGNAWTKSTMPGLVKDTRTEDYKHMLRLNFKNDINISPSYDIAPLLFNADDFMVFAGMFDKANGTAALYVNGVKVDELTGLDVTLGVQNAIALGSSTLMYVSTGMTTSRMKFREFVYYDQVLSDEQIEATYNHLLQKWR